MVFYGKLYIHNIADITVSHSTLEQRNLDIVVVGGGDFCESSH